MELEHVKLSFTKGAIQAIAREANKRKTGARGLRSIMERVMLDVMYDVPSDPKVRECIVGEAVIGGKETPKIIRDKKLQMPQAKAS